MNAYLCIVEDIPILQEYIWDQARYEDEDIVELVFVETYGQAKRTFANRHWFSGVEFTSIDHCRIVLRNVERERGLAKSSDPLWEDFS